MALILKRRGIERVRPLTGGYRAWRERGYPMTGISIGKKATPATPRLTPVTSGGSYA